MHCVVEDVHGGDLEVSAVEAGSSFLRFKPCVDLAHQFWQVMRVSEVFLDGHLRI